MARKVVGGEVERLVRNGMSWILEKNIREMCKRPKFKSQCYQNAPQMPQNAPNAKMCKVPHVIIFHLRERE